MFRKGTEGMPRPGIGYRVGQVDADAGTVQLADPKGRPLTWTPAR